jgi:hypothetical protein
MLRRFCSSESFGADGTRLLSLCAFHASWHVLISLVCRYQYVKIIISSSAYLSDFWYYQKLLYVLGIGDAFFVFLWLLVLSSI